MGMSDRGGRAMRVEIRWEPSGIAPHNPSSELVLGPKPDHVETMRFCPVCSDANGMEIVHNGPMCEEGKPAFSRYVTP